MPSKVLATATGTGVLRRNYHYSCSRCFFEKRHGLSILLLVLFVQWVVQPWNSVVIGQVKSESVYQDQADPENDEAEVDYSLNGPAFVSRQMSLLRDDQILEKLNLDKDQRSDLREIEYEWRAQLATLVQRHPETKEGKQRLNELKNHYASLSKEIEEVLGPDSTKLLRQLAIRRMVTFKENSRFLLVELIESPYVAKHLELNESSRSKIKSEADKLATEIDRVVASMEAEATEKLRDLLSESQKQKLEDLFGSPQKFPTTRTAPKQ